MWNFRLTITFQYVSLHMPSTRQSNVNNKLSKVFSFFSHHHLKAFLLPRLSSRQIHLVHTRCHFEIFVHYNSKQFWLKLISVLQYIMRECGFNTSHIFERPLPKHENLNDSTLELQMSDGI